MEKNEKLTLKEALALLREDELICIGASYGSGWLCFTKAGDLDGIQAAFDTYYKGEQIKLQGRQARLFRYVTKPPALTGYLKEDWKRVRRRVRSIQEILPMIKTVQNYLDNYTPPLERFVVDYYPKEVDGPRWGIVIEGTEIGYWTKSEVEEG